MSRLRPKTKRLSAILFLYQEALGRELDRIDGVVRAKKPIRLPAVLSREEVRSLFGCMSGQAKLVALLLYGGGLRLLEALRLRIKDIDFTSNQVTVRDGKGQKDRITMLPAAAKELLQAHLGEVRAMHQRDLRLGLGDVFLPEALSRKYPNAGRAWRWQYLFPASSISVDPRSSVRRRHHLDESSIQRAVAEAARRGGDQQTRVAAHSSAFIRHASVGRRL